MSSKKYNQEIDVHSENGISEGNNIENIPWSQQVDEALTDLSSNYTEKVSDGTDVNASNLQCNNINLNVENKGNSDVNCSKRMTWANIASQPLKHNYRKNACSFMSKKKGMPPPPMIPGKFIMDLRENVHQSYNSPSVPNANVQQNNYRGRKHHTNSMPVPPTTDEEFYQEKDVAHRGGSSDKNNIKVATKHSKMPSNSGEPQQQQQQTNPIEFVVEELKIKNNYNPTELDLESAERARFFVIKSYSEDDIHRSIKYEIWCSTDHGNKRLDSAFRERKNYGGVIYLLFSVNGSGHFCGMAQMITSVDYNSISNVWSQDKWKGKFKVKWIYVKDVPNGSLRHIRLENNENKSVTHSRDAQEVPNAKGVQVLRILHSFKHETSIFDDFNHYEKKQEAEVSKKDTNCQNNQRAFNNIHNKPTQNNFNREYMHEGSNNRKKNSFKSQKSYGFKDFSSEKNMKQNDFKNFSDNTPQINKNNKICNEI